MVDLGTGLTGLAIALGAKELLGKVLGPTADYAGERTRDVVKAGDENLRRVLAIALRRLGSRSDGPDAVPPKVIKGLLTEAPFCDDELAAEYFGGVLASSRTGNPRDDRGAALLALIGRMTTYQIRAHFLVYLAIKAASDAEDRMGNCGDDPRAFIPMKSFEEGMDFSAGEDRKAIVGHAISGLVREELIASGPIVDDEDAIQKLYYGSSGPGLVVGPSLQGAELFLWAHGRGDVASQDFLGSEVVLENESGIFAPEGTVIVQRRPTRTENAVSAHERAVRDEAMIRAVAEDAARSAQARWTADLASQFRRLR